MPTVKIDTPGVTVELTASEASIGELGKQAMDLFREATEVNKNASKPAPWPKSAPSTESRSGSPSPNNSRRAEAAQRR